MIIREAEESKGSGDEEGAENKKGSGYTIGGDFGCYEWDHTVDLPSKDN